jgi:hypothetical protein
MPRAELLRLSQERLLHAVHHDPAGLELPRIPIGIWRVSQVHMTDSEAED